MICNGVANWLTNWPLGRKVVGSIPDDTYSKMIGISVLIEKKVV